MNSFDGFSLSSASTADLVHDVESVHNLVQEGKVKAGELRASLKNLETTNGRLGNHFVKAQNEVNETFQFFNNVLEERKAEVMRELEAAYASKQMTLQVYNQKAQETVEKMYQVIKQFSQLVWDK